MNKNIFSYLLGGLMVIGLYSSCAKEPEESVITNVPFTIESVDQGESLSEKGRLMTVNFSLDADQIVATSVQVSVDPRSTATAGEDYNFEPVVVDIPAYVRTGSFQYEILEDLDAEEDENITFVLSGVHEPFGASNSVEHVVTIKDSIYSTLNLTFDWDGIGVFDGSEFPLCGNVDMDVYVLDAAGTDLGIYDAATGACPEVMVVDDSWADGTYFLATNMYENGFDSLFINTPYPITVSAVKGGVFRETFTPTDVWTSEDEDFVNDGNGGFKALMTLEKTGTTYKVSLPDGTLVVQGLVANGPHSGKVPTMSSLKRN